MARLPRLNLSSPINTSLGAVKTGNSALLQSKILRSMPAQIYSHPKNEITPIREGLQRNQLTGNHRFVDEIESRIGMRIEKRGRGRPRHEEK